MDRGSSYLLSGKIFLLRTAFIIRAPVLYLFCNLSYWKKDYISYLLNVIAFIWKHCCFFIYRLFHIHHRKKQFIIFIKKLKEDWNIICFPLFSRTSNVRNFLFDKIKLVKTPIVILNELIQFRKIIL